MNRSIQTLFNVGTTSGLSDASLLDRFLHHRDEAAFEALVVRHGPMVQDVCRSILRDPHAADDAFQATFLVLTRQAHSIRRRDALGSWLFGVARRVAVHSRYDDARRRRFLAQKLASTPMHQNDSPSDACDAAALHEELNRLPEKYRAPIILCYWQGLSYEAAAQQLGCPVGTLSVRLRRAKERLKTRLTRRGIGVSAGLLVAGAGSPASSSAVPVALAEAAARTAVQFSATHTGVAGTVPAAVLTLTQGVLKSMAMTKFKVFALVVGSICLAGIGGTTIVAQQTAGGKGSPEKKGVDKRTQDRSFTVRQHVLEAARRRLETQRAFYEEGRITIDRFLNALSQVKDAELAIAQTPEQRVAAVAVYVARLEDVEKREKLELSIGRGTTADVEEATLQRELGEVELERARTPNGPLDLDSLDRRLSALERKIDIILKRLPAQPATP